jgi:hypothetical protein
MSGASGEIFGEDVCFFLPWGEERKKGFLIP